MAKITLQESGTQSNSFTNQVNAQLGKSHIQSEIWDVLALYSASSLVQCGFGVWSRGSVGYVTSYFRWTRENRTHLIGNIITYLVISYRIDLCHLNGSSYSQKQHSLYHRLRKSFWKLQGDYRPKDAWGKRLLFEEYNIAGKATRRSWDEICREIIHWKAAIYPVGWETKTYTDLR